VSSPSKGDGTLAIVLRNVLVFSVTYGSGALGFALPVLGARLALPLLPTGIAIGALYRWGRAMWPAVFVAGFAIERSLDAPVIAAVGVGAGLTAGVLLTDWLLRHWRFDPGFTRGRDVSTFLLAAVIGMVVPPTLGQLGYLLAGDSPLEGWWLPWARWWGDNTAGVLLVSPLLLSITRQSLKPRRSRWFAGTVWLLGFAALVGAIWVVPSATGRAPVALTAMTLVVLAAIRFGVVAAAAATFLFSCAMALSFAFDIGAFGGYSEFAGLIALWSFSGATVGLTLLITALLAERDAAAAARLGAERRYAQIFDRSPQPLWVHDPVTLRFLLVNEAAVQQYGWSREQLLAREITLLEAPDEEHVVPPQGAGEPPAIPGPFETRHRTRNGTVLDVEVWTRSIELGSESGELVFAINVTERRALSRALLEAINGEQRRIGQDMHDGLGQELTGLALTARALEMQATRDSLSIAPELERLATLASGCIESTRRIVRGLSPLSDADGNLPAAIEALARTSSLSGTDVQAHTHLDAPLSLPVEARTHLLRIVQEAVQNALKHANANAVDVELWVRPGAVTLSIDDDGRGLPPGSDAGPGLGMRTMRFRAAAIGGRLSVSARRGGGTRIVCEAPQSAPVAASA
jgi:PAS domain S-box-containing protein